MGKFKSNESNGDNNLSLDKYVEKLKDYKEKAEKVFRMGGSNPYSVYVLSSLQFAIDVAQGKAVTAEERKAVLRSAEELTTNALGFHNKFAKTRENIERSDNNEAAEKESKGPGFGQK